MDPDDSDDTPQEEPLHGHWTPLSQCSRIEVEWLIKNQLPIGTHFLVGPPKKARKSTAALAQALMVSGKSINAFPSHMREVERTGRVAILSPEAEGGILRQAAEDGLGIELDPYDESIVVADDPWEFRLDSERGRRNFMGWMRDLKPVLAVIDPLNRLHSANENDASEMMMILGPLGMLAHELRMCLLIIHHITKPPKDAKPDANLSPYDMRGTGALYGMADGVTTITPKKERFLHFDSVFKRAEDYSRTIRLGIWGEEAKEWMSDLDKEVYKRVKDGLGEEELAEALGKDTDDITLSLEKLRRNRYLGT